MWPAAQVGVSTQLCVVRVVCFILNLPLTMQGSRWFQQQVTQVTQVTAAYSLRFPLVSHSETTGFSQPCRVGHEQRRTQPRIPALAGDHMGTPKRCMEPTTTSAPMSLGALARTNDKGSAATMKYAPFLVGCAAVSTLLGLGLGG